MARLKGLLRTISTRWGSDSEMSATLPVDFPMPARDALGVIQKADSGVYDKLVNFVELYWGDVDLINNVINDTWIPARKQVIESLNRMDVELRDRLMNQDAVSLWAGDAR